MKGIYHVDAEKIGIALDDGGVRLALAEFRQIHTDSRHDEEDVGCVGAS